MNHFRYIFLTCLVVMLVACGVPSPPKSYKVKVYDTPSQPDLRPTQRPYEVNGQRYQPIASASGFVQEGLASWYGKKFHGRKTSNGEIYDMYAMTSAHKTLPMNVYLKVTNLANSRTTVVRVNDRGPFVKGRIIDLSYSAAQKLGVVGPGTAPVRIEALGYKEQGTPDSEPRFKPLDNYEIGPFMVQVGAFTVKANAYRLAEKLKLQYGSSSVVEGQVNGQVFYRVRVGLYNTMTQAGKALLQFESGGYPSSFVVAK